jgi:hypothetical protein
VIGRVRLQPDWARASGGDERASGGPACPKPRAGAGAVAFCGRLSLSEWTPDSGPKRSKHEVIDRVKFLSGPNGSAAEGAEADAGKSDEEITF